MISRSCKGLYPESTYRSVMAAARGASTRVCPQASSAKAARQDGLIALTKALPLPVTGAEPIEDAVITAGGAKT